MKKILYILSLAFLVFSISGCRTKTETQTPETPVIPEVTPTPEVTETEEVYYKYTDFTGSEKNKLNNLINDTIPFIPNNEYYFELENGIITYKIVGNKEADLEKFSKDMSALGYTYIGWTDSQGHSYTKGNILVGCGFKVEDGKDNIYIFITLTDFDYPTLEPNPDETEEPAITFTVTYIINGHGTQPANLSDVTLLPQTLPELEADGWIFDGWYTDEALTSKAIAGAELIDDITLYAKWTEEKLENQESSIQKILDEAASLSLGGKLTGNKTASGYVKSIEEEYTTQYKTISFILSDGVAEILVHRTKSSCASTLKVGDYVIVTGTVIKYDDKNEGIIEFQYPEVTLDSSGNDNSSSGNQGTHTYNDFTSNEKTLISNTVGTSIPFIPNDEYIVEEFTESGVGSGIYFGTVGNTQAEYELYLDQIETAGFIFDYTSDDDGNTWYYYYKGDLYLDVIYWNYEGDMVIDLYIYYPEENSGSSDDSSNNTPSDVNMITNDGKGLPTGTDGVYNVNFNDATYVKNVHDQGYYLDGCPTTGDVKVLVIPVEFSDRTASSLGYDLSKLNLIFNGETGTTDYYSVKEYYNISSYGKLDLDFFVLDSWFRPSNNSSYYLNATMDYYGSETVIGDQIIMNEALAYLEDKIDLTEFDSDGNNIIDAVVMINTLDINSDVDMQWAYRYWNIYTDSNEEYYEYDGVSANDYLWASYKFLLEDYDNPNTYDVNNMNPYTFIHEFGHVLGSDDYYDYAGVNEPLFGCDMMDALMGDHNPFTKFNYGWITSSRLVVASDNVTLTLEDFSVNGDTIIIALNWDSTLGAYQEYFVLMYYKNTGLNGGDYGLFAEEGIVVYHVNSSLYVEESEGEIYYDIYNNNTDASDSTGTVDNLIEIIKSTDDTIIHTVGNECNQSLPYVFSVDALTETEATITFTKNN